MKCPYCGGETKKGSVKISGGVPFSYGISWFPEEDRGKLFKNNLTPLNNTAEGYHCGNCDKFIAVFGRK